MNPSDPQPRTPRRPSILSGFGLLTWSLAFVLVAGLVLLFVGRPLLRAGKSWYGARLVKEARQHMADEDWKAASKTIVDAMRWIPDDPVLLRTMADFMIQTRSEPRLLLQTLAKLEERALLSESDAIERVRALLLARDVPAARLAYERLTRAQKDKPAARDLHAEILREEGDTAQAAEVRVERMQADQDNPQAVLELAVKESRNEFPEIQRAAMQRLWKLAGGDDVTALGAINYLGTLKELTLVDVQRLEDLVEAHPLTQPANRLSIQSALMRRAPERREAILAAEAERYREGTSLEHLTQAMRWLALEKQHARILSIVPMTKATRSTELFAIIAQALAAEQRWDDLRKFVADRTNSPVSRERCAVWLAEAHMHLPDGQAEARRQLQFAIERCAVTGNNGAMLAAAEVAEKHGQWDIASQAFQALGRSGTKMDIPMREKAYEMAVQQRDTVAMLEATRGLLADRPDSQVFAQRLAWLRLILGEEMELVSGIGFSEKGVLEIPQPLFQALAAYRMNDLESMKRHLARLTAASDLPPGQRAVFAGLLAISGALGPAYQVAEKVPESLLLDEEKRFLALAK